MTNADILVKLETTTFEDKVRSFIEHKGKTGAGYSWLNQAVSAVRLFCIANRINLNFPWLYAKIPKPDTAGNQKLDFDQDKPYTAQQINAIIKVAGKENLRPVCSIICMAQGSCRVGALPTLRLEPKYMQLVEKYNLYALQAYPETTAAYWVILPPQASPIIESYRGKREKGPLFVNKFDGKEPTTKASLVSEIWRLAIRAKVRKKNKDGDTLTRHDNMLDHGFRKWHSTQLEKAKLTDDHISRLRGHKKGLKGIYQLPNPLEIIEITDFMQAVPLLELEALQGLVKAKA